MGRDPIAGYYRRGKNGVGKTMRMMVARCLKKNVGVEVEGACYGAGKKLAGAALAGIQKKGHVLVLNWMRGTWVQLSGGQL